MEGELILGRGELGQLGGGEGGEAVVGVNCMREEPIFNHKNSSHTQKVKGHRYWRVKTILAFPGITKQLIFQTAYRKASGLTF